MVDFCSYWTKDHFMENFVYILLPSLEILISPVEIFQDWTLQRWDCSQK